MGLVKKFKQQFEKPEGILGAIAEKLMATVGAEKNEWTLSLLHLEEDDNVLEIGFGPGIGIELASKAIESGKIIGIDYSEKMLQQARKRNKKAINKGIVQLIHTDIENIPSFNFMFDKVYSINSIIFWKEPIKTLKDIRQIMNNNGVIAITVQPFKKGATEETAKQLGSDIVKQLKEAGFSDIKVELKQMKQVASVCVVGVNK